MELWDCTTFNQSPTSRQTSTQVQPGSYLEKSLFSQSPTACCESQHPSTLKGWIRLETELFFKLPRWCPVPESQADTPFPQTSRSRVLFPSRPSSLPRRPVPEWTTSRRPPSHQQTSEPHPIGSCEVPDRVRKGSPRLCYLCDLDIGQYNWRK